MHLSSPYLDATFSLVVIAICLISWYQSSQWLSWVVGQQAYDRTIGNHYGWRYEWRRRSVTTVINAIASSLNLIVLLQDYKKPSIIMSYSWTAHFLLLLVGIHYVFDTIAMIRHPDRSFRTRFVWILHHTVSIAFCFAMRTVQKGSFVASIFMISSVSHLPANLRWVQRKLRLRKYNALDLLLGYVFTFTFFSSNVLPVPILFYMVARQNNFTRQQLYDFVPLKCTAGTLLIFVLHVLLFFRMFAKDTQLMIRLISSAMTHSEEGLSSTGGIPLKATRLTGGSSSLSDSYPVYELKKTL